MSINENKLHDDSRVVLTLDAGGTNFRFSALQGGKRVGGYFNMASNGNDLERCLENICTGFSESLRSSPVKPVAISFAFPGPADYRKGIVGDLRNLPAFRGGVALGPMLEERFQVPVFMMNDGDLFTHGEAIGGILPNVNQLLSVMGNSKRFKNLLGITIGTGFGGGISINGKLLEGDNFLAGEICQMRHKGKSMSSAEEGISIRAVQRVYAELSGTAIERTPSPEEIARIADGQVEGNMQAAKESFRVLGEVIGDAIANAHSLIDGLVVIGGGISGASRHFMSAVMTELNNVYIDSDGLTRSRLVAQAYNLECPSDLEQFAKTLTQKIQIPGTTKTVAYDQFPRFGVGISKLGTTQAITLGAYALALERLDHN